MDIDNIKEIVDKHLVIIAIKSQINNQCKNPLSILI